MDQDTDARAPRQLPQLAEWEGWQRYWLLYALAVLLMLGVAWAALSANEELDGTLAEIAHLQEASKQMMMVGQSTVDLETGQRGYLLTGDERYLEPYATAERDIDAQFLAVDAALGTYPAAREELAAIREALRKKRGELAATLTLYRQQGRDAALDLVRSDYGRQATDDIRHAITRLAADVRGIVQERQAGMSAIIASRNATIFTAIGLAIAAVGASLLLLRRHLRALRAEEQLRQQRDRADRASREKSIFLANMSHEIRTPMNAIFGFGQLLSERVTDPQDKHYVEAIVSSGRALLTLINDVLDLSRIEAGRLDIRPQPTSLRELVAGVAALFSQLAADKALRLVAQVEPGVPDVLELDPGRLRQVLFNLVGNAIKYTDRGHVRIAVAARPAPDDEAHATCTIDVEDTGIGIAAADQSRIFDPFVQAPGAGEAREGSGLGLSITRRLVRLMGGEITLDSTPGKGSRFRVRLLRVPVVATPTPAPAMPDPALAELPAGTVLVVDDVALNRRLVEAMLRGSALRVLHAEDGETGVRLARQHRPEIVLMDIRMPGIDGVTALERLRADPALAATRIVALSASNLTDDDDERRRRFDGYLRKPVARGLLLAELKRLLPQAPPPADARPASPLAAALAALERDHWPRLRATLASRDCARFATHLATLAARGSSPMLAAYAQRLQSAADLVDPHALESTLAEFPRVRAQIDSPTGPP